VLVAVNINAQQMDKAPVPIKTEGDIKKEAVINQATAESVAEVAIERTNAKMSFESLNVDYGTIENGAEPLRIVKFTNTGTDPLVIKNARGSCGCTVPTWPKEPIAPGQSATMEVRYDTKRTGKISKSITISTNEGPDSHTLQVIGEVLPPKEDKSVPVAEPTIIKGN
jgi:Protein of unknown function (DUF1573)